MRYLFLPFFLIRLTFSALPSLAALAKIKTSHLLPFLLMAIFLASQVFFLSKHFYNPPVKPTVSSSSTTIISEKIQNSNLPYYQIDSEQLDAEIEKFEAWQEKNFQNRDILINLSNLYQAKEDEQQSDFYLNQAKNLDPNHLLFKNLEK